MKAPEIVVNAVTGYELKAVVSELIEALDKDRRWRRYMVVLIWVSLVANCLALSMFLFLWHRGAFK